MIVMMVMGAVTGSHGDHLLYIIIIDNIMGVLHYDLTDIHVCVISHAILQLVRHTLLSNTTCRIDIIAKLLTVPLGCDEKT